MPPPNRPEHPAPLFNHPGQIINSVKTATGFTPSQWRQFCRLGQVSPSDYPGSPALRDLATGYQALADAHVPAADPCRAADLLSLAREHRLFQEAAWDRGDAWQAWTNILRRYLEPSEDPPPRHILLQITDAFKYHLRHQLPWGPGTWEALKARSDRWHRNQGIYLPQPRYTLPPAAKASSWESLLPDTTINGLTFHPLTTAAELQSAGTLMNNCIPIFWEDCAAGHTRIFTVFEKDNLIAAVEIYQDESDWQPGQTEAKDRKEPSPRVTAAAIQLANRYNDAAHHQGTKHPEQAV